MFMIPFQAAAAPQRRDALRSAPLVWLENAFRRCRIVDELRGRPDRPAHQLAAAVGAAAVEHGVRAGAAEGALEGADARVGGIRGQIAVATLATGPQLEHGTSFACPQPPEGR